VASPANGIAIAQEMRSGLVSASRLGINSPNITWPAVIRPTAVPRPMPCAYSAASGHRPSIQPAMVSPIASPPNTPVSTPIRVMPICTVDNRLSGCSARASALRAPRLGWTGSSASWRNRDLRDVIRAISDIAKKALRTISAATIRISSMEGQVIALSRRIGRPAMVTGRPDGPG